MLSLSQRMAGSVHEKCRHPCHSSKLEERKLNIALGFVFWIMHLKNSTNFTFLVERSIRQCLYGTHCEIITNRCRRHCHLKLDADHLGFEIKTDFGCICSLVTRTKHYNFREVRVFRPGKHGQGENNQDNNWRRQILFFINGRWILILLQEMRKISKFVLTLPWNSLPKIQKSISRRLLLHNPNQRQYTIFRRRSPKPPPLGRNRQLSSLNIRSHASSPPTGNLDVGVFQNCRQKRRW